jgi:hypothetical protein
VGLAVCPLPQPIILAVNEIAIDICADGNLSFIATDKGNIYKLGAVFGDNWYFYLLLSHILGNVLIFILFS